MFKMRVRNKYMIDISFFWTMFIIASICITVPVIPLIIVPSPFNFIVFTVLMFIYWLAGFIYFFACLIYSLGYNEIDPNGITRHFLFYKKHYSWNDLQFISKSRTQGRLGASIEKIVVSVEIPIENLKRKNINPMYSKKCFYIPYSQDLEEYIIANSPITCYTYSYIIDDTIKNY